MLRKLLLALSLAALSTLGLAADVSTWSTTPGSNNSASPDGAPEGMAPSAVNDVIRQNMAEIAEWYMDNECSLASAVGTDSYAVTTNVVYAALTDISGLCFEADVANTGAATLNVDSLGAKAIVKYNDVALVTGDIEANQRVVVVYNADDLTFEMVSQLASGASPTLTNLTLTGDLSVEGNTTLGNAVTDTITATGEFITALLPDVDDTYDLGSTSQEWQDAWFDGTVNIDSLVADTADINGGTVDGATIGGTSAGAITATTLSATGAVSFTSTFDLTTDTVDVADGGSGAATLTGLLQGNGTSAFTGISNSSTVGQALRVTGASTYAWGAVDLADGDAITGNLPVANLNSGTSASSSTFWRGDGTWAAPAATDAVDIQVFTISGTWTKPANAQISYVYAIGGGGGGGSGDDEATGVIRLGGGGGEAGDVCVGAFPAYGLDATETVTIGAAGTGGAASTAEGVNGVAGGNSLFDSFTVVAGGDFGDGDGDGGTAGTASTCTNGTIYEGGDGATSSSTGDATDATDITDSGAAGGGAGGSYDAANVSRAGSDGGGAGALAGGPDGANGATCAAGTDGGDSTGGAERGGAGAGGGGAESPAAENGCAGGVGGNYGAGGGGGGANTGSGSSGAGGDGAAGVVVVITIVGT